jgi:5-methylcytosine-specific restriction endonuclease McrA
MTTLCNLCKDQPVFDKGFCSDCLEDLISKVEASKLIGVSLQRMERIIEQYPALIHVYPYMTQVRLSGKEIKAFMSKQPDARVNAGAKWSNHFKSCRSCKSESNEHYGGGYCIDCYGTSKESIILQKYMDGNNLAEIGAELNISRERARQIFAKSTAIELSRMGENITKRQKEDILNTIELTYKQNRASRDFKQVIEDKYSQIIETLRTKAVLSEFGLLKSIGLPASAIHLIEDDYPEFLELISANKNRWSWKFDKCRMCDKTENKHKRWGYCDKCYTRSDEWKKQQYAYRANNQEKIRERQKKYEATYYSRPEVKKRLMEYGYDRRYDGNRDIALERDKFTCIDCGMIREVHKAKYNMDLAVFHIDGNLENNKIDNLVTVCRVCMAKRAAKKSGNLV